MNSLITKLLIAFIVVMAFVNGILVADHFNEEAVSATPVDGIELEAIPYEEKMHEKSASVIIQDVPYTVQAPFGWTDPWTDYAEEASIYMAQLWLNNQELPDLEQRATDLLNLGSQSTTDQISLEESLRFLPSEVTSVSQDTSLESLLTQLQDGNIILVPVNGQLIESPYYGDPAPEHHMMLIIGFNKDEGVFITNDPGTVRGEELAYEYEKILNAIQDLDGESRIGIIQP